jgi:hypothetical protein
MSAFRANVSVCVVLGLLTSTAGAAAIETVLVGNAGTAWLPTTRTARST